MRPTKLWTWVLGVEGFVVEDVEFEQHEQSVIVHVRPKSRHEARCPHCYRRCPGYDRGDVRRRWRALDAGITQLFVEAEAPRITCEEHGVVVAAVPWARHDSGFVKPFEDQVAWLAAHTDKTTVSKLMRISWRTVGRIIERVTSALAKKIDRFGNIKRIGVDEVAYRKGQRYLTLVVDHDTGRLVWAHDGRNETALQGFFDALGPERCAKIELVSVDAAPWYLPILKSTFRNAAVCIDPFHVVAWAGEALDTTRRELWRQLQRSGDRQVASTLKGARWALCKNPENLTDRQRVKLSEVKRLNAPLYTAYILKEQLRAVFRLKGDAGVSLLAAWVAWASSSRLLHFVKAAKTIRNHWDGIVASLEHGLSNARVEALNNQLRLITRFGFGFHTPGPVIALGMLRLGGLCPPLPGRG